jgi:hypothetical protein
MRRPADLITNAALATTMFVARHNHAHRFIEATLEPMTHQQRLLQQILSENADTEFGREHGFGAIDGIRDYRKSVPANSYADLKPYIDRQRRTGKPALTRESPIMYNRTSGTTGEPKFLPVTQTGLRALCHLQRLFAQAQYSQTSFYGGRILAVVSPACEGVLEKGYAYGSATGRIYETMPELVQSKYVVPPELFGVSEYDAKYYAIAALGLKEKGITGLAAGNPSTFCKLIEVIRNRWDRLVEDIAQGSCAVEFELNEAQRAAFFGRFRPDRSRARELTELRAATRKIEFADIWPHLSAVVTWTGASCGFALNALAQGWPKATRILEAGYISSEFWGSVNIDIAREACVPTITTSFVEFVERANWESGGRDFCTLGELEAGQQYYVFVTTVNGLYRYDMNDIVEVTGYFNATPTIAFVQKGRGVTSITGEKLYENQVTQAVATVQKDRALSIPFFVAFADDQARRYEVYLEADCGEGCSPEFIGRRIDERLGELNIEYREKRRSGRLRPLSVIPVRPGTGDLYRKHCVARGQSDAQFKVLRLQRKRDCAFDFARQQLTDA